MRKFLFVAVIIFLTGILLSGCYDGLVSEEEYATLIKGVVATKENGESVNYSLEILKDEISFNGEIQSAAYSKIEILPYKECKVKGICFYVRCLKDASLNFNIFTNNKYLDSTFYKCESFEEQEIYFFFDASVILNENNSLYVLVEELTESGRENKTKFVFDTLLIFFEED